MSVTFGYQLGFSIMIFYDGFYTFVNKSILEIYFITKPKKL